MNLATAWLLLTKRRESLLLIIAGIVLFGGGWHVGRVMSPYYTAQPIIFQEAPAGEGSANNGDPAALLALREADEEAAPKPNTPAPVTDVNVAGAQDETEPAVPPSTTPAGEESALFVGSVNSDLYHYKTCTAWLRIKEENRRWFQTREEAEAAGYKPSKCTQETLGL